MPGLPGAAWTSSVLRARTRACSRPPDPMTSMRTPGAYRRPLTAAREPLVGQHREVQLVAPPALEELVVDQAGLLPHAEPPGQPRRRLVVLVDPRDDAMQAELLEAEPQHAGRRLGCIALPAQGRVEHVADLAAGVLATVPHQDDVARHFAGGGHLGAEGERLAFVGELGP